MKFNYGDTLRIRNELYTILGKIRYIDTHWRIWYKYKLVKHKNNAEFWISWNEKHDVYQFTKLCGKVIPSDMNVVHRSYQMAIGTRGDIDTDIDKGQKPQSDVYEEIIKYLNEKTGSHFKPTSKSTQRLINGRLSENYTIEDFKYVIDVKTNEWKDNTKMSKYLTPDTLFNASKFEKYRNQQMPKQPNIQKQDERLGF